MLKVLLSLYFTCYCCYIFYTREPDYFDGETTTAIINIDSKTKEAIAIYSIANQSYKVKANYPLRQLINQQQIELIYLPQHPEKAAVYSLWGYWFTWGEILMSSVLLFAMYQLAVSITQNPTAASLANQLKIDDVPKRKYEG